MNNTNLLLVQKKIALLNETKKQLFKDLIKELFIAIPKLDYLEIKYNQEYNDNDYYDSFEIAQINKFEGVANDYFLEELGEYFNDDESYDSENPNSQHPVARDTDLNYLELSEIVNILNWIEKDLFDGYGSLKFKRKEVLKHVNK